MKTGPKRVLVIDDQPEPRRLLERALQSFGHEVETASDGLEGLAKLMLGVDLLVTDAQMPGMDGFQVTRQVRSDPQHQTLPILMVTGMNTQEDRLRAVEAGVNDFIAKPFDIVELKVRTTSLLNMKQTADLLQQEREALEHEVQRRTASLRRALDEMVAAQREAHMAHLDAVWRLVLAAERRDRAAAGHVERIGRLCRLIGQAMGLSPSEVETLEYASHMHDVGKIGIPDRVLLKTGPLDPEDWVIMKQHPIIGAEILRGSPSPLLQLGQTVALTHHEWWDGSGYPQGLVGTAIPMPGRICAVADVFDALTEVRRYRDAWPSERAFTLIQDERGTHFDPDVVDVFLSQREAADAVRATSPESAAPQAQRTPGEHQ